MKSFRRILMMIGTVLPSWLRILLLRLLGHHVGKGVRISMGTVLCANEIEIEDDVHIGPLNIVMSSSKIRLAYGSDISFMVIISGRGSFHLGQRSYVSVQTFIDLEGDVTIGSYSGTGPRTMIFTHAIFLPPSRGYPRVVRPTRIGNFVWLGGMNFLTAGTTVGDNVMTAPGSRLSSQIASNVYWISQERQLPMGRMCRVMDQEKLVALAHDIIADFSRSEDLNYTRDDYWCRVGDWFFQIGKKSRSSAQPASAIFLIGEEEAEETLSEGHWYNLVSLRCSDSCTRKLDEKLKLHLRKYFGLHFLPIGQVEEPVRSRLE